MSTTENYHDESNINRNNNNNNDTVEPNQISIQNMNNNENIQYKTNNCSLRKKIIFGVIIGSLILTCGVVALIIILKKKKKR